MASGLKEGDTLVQVPTFAHRDKQRCFGSLSSCRQDREDMRAPHSWKRSCNLLVPAPFTTLPHKHRFNMCQKNVLKNIQLNPQDITG